MNDDWLFDMLRKIEAAALKHGVSQLEPLIEAGYAAAMQELRTSKPMRTFRPWPEPRIAINVAEAPPVVPKVLKFPSLPRD